MAACQKGDMGCTLPETNIGPNNGWLEDDSFPFGKPYFQGDKALVSGSVLGCPWHLVNGLQPL